jgi:hypothetical protein
MTATETKTRAESSTEMETASGPAPRMRHSTHSVAIEASYDAAYTYLEDWRNQPEWATSFVKAIRPDGDGSEGGAVITSPQGEIPVRFRCDRALGVLDMIFPGESVLPTRLTPLGPGELLYTFTFSMPGDVPEAAFRESQRNMDEELGQLKRILESRSGAGPR